MTPSLVNALIIESDPDRASRIGAIFEQAEGLSISLEVKPCLSDCAAMAGESSSRNMIDRIDDSQLIVEKASSSLDLDAPSSMEREALPRKALIVDDEEVLRMVLNSILSALGFETIVASDGLEAVRLYEANRDSVTLAIIDLNMPGLDGGEVFQKIREDGRRIPILVTSGLDDFDALPFDDFEKENSRFLMKPFGAGDVRKSIEKLLGKNETEFVASKSTVV